MSNNVLKPMKVFVGLSGGVDSAVSAALLKQAGHEVTGVFIRISLPGYPCSSGEDKIEAQRVAAHLKIPFKTIDLSNEYKEEVFVHTIKEFKAGHTPNPDTLCNQKIKFGAFFNWCMKEGADLVATGHYARTKDGRLYAGLDQTKDQSYFLWMVPKEALLKTLFPIGHLEKSKVRELATSFGLPNAKRHDSQGLCFLGDVSIEDMLKQELTLVEGDVLNEAGKVVGSHSGAALYTMGQRHGFTLHEQSSTLEPHYVVGKNVKENTIVVSASKFPHHAKATALSLINTNWISKPVTGNSYEARYRYRQPLIKAVVNDGSNTTLQEPLYVPLGQSLVLYNKDKCLGGGVIDTSMLITS